MGLSAELKWKFEEEFQLTGCFVNGLNEKSSHMDAYMTVMEYVKVDEVFAKIKDKYAESLEEILEALIRADYPMQRLLGLHLKNRV